MTHTKQINLFEYCPDILPPIPAVKISDLQLQKVYDNLFSLKCMRNKIEYGDVKGVMDVMMHFTKGGCIGKGVGWSEQNPTTFWLDKRGIEFDDNGVHHSFHDVAVLLIHKYST